MRNDRRTIGWTFNQNYQRQFSRDVFTSHRASFARSHFNFLNLSRKTCRGFTHYGTPWPLPFYFTLGLTHDRAIPFTFTFPLENAIAYSRVIKLLTTGVILARITWKGTHVGRYMFHCERGSSYALAIIESLYRSMGIAMINTGNVKQAIFQLLRKY